MNFNFSDFLGILGIVFTIGFGVWGIITFFNKRYPGNITFVEQTSIGLFNSLVKNFPEIKIFHNDEAIDEQLVYVKASIVNTGSIDLTTNSNDKNFEIQLSEGFKWINCKLTDKSEDVLSSIEIVDTNLIFEFDLLRTNEFIQFESIIRILDNEKSVKKLKKALIFKHRIPNTSKVTVEPFLSDEEVKEKRINIWKFFGMLSILIGFIPIATIYNIKHPSSLKYTYEKDNITHLISAKPDGLMNVEIEYFKTKKDTTFRLVDFQKLNSLTPVIPETTFWKEMQSKWYLLIFVLIYFYLSFTEFSQIRKTTMIRKILDKNNN